MGERHRYCSAEGAECGQRSAGGGTESSEVAVAEELSSLSLLNWSDIFTTIRQILKIHVFFLINDSDLINLNTSINFFSSNTVLRSVPFVAAVSVELPVFSHTGNAWGKTQATRRKCQKTGECVCWSCTNIPPCQFVLPLKAYRLFAVCERGGQTGQTANWLSKKWKSSRLWWKPRTGSCGLFIYSETDTMLLF